MDRLAEIEQIQRRSFSAIHTPLDWGLRLSYNTVAMDVFEILKDQLYQSGAPLGDGDWATIRGRKIDVVVDLYGALEADLPTTPNSIIYLYWPILDIAALPDMQVMDILTDTVVRLIRTGHRILVHCHMGKSRSGLFNAIVLTKLQHISGHEALGIVRQGRPGAVGNQTFAGYLEQLPAPPADPTR